MTARTGPEAALDAVVVGVDDSEAGEQALSWAADQAALEHRRLLLVRAAGALPSPRNAWLDSVDEASSWGVRALVQDEHALLDGAVERVRTHHPELVVDTCVALEETVTELRLLAERAHLVVLGSRGPAVLRHLSTWQVGARTAHGAGCPVVVVPHHDPDTVRHGVLVGTDLTERSRPVLSFGYEQASRRDLPLTVVHVVPDRWDTAEVQRSERQLAEVVSGLAEEFPDVLANLRVIDGSPAAELLRLGERMHLLVIGQHRRVGVGERPFGHVRTSVVDRSRCPVAVVPFTVHGSPASA